jgi:hypothetical protein
MNRTGSGIEEEHHGLDADGDNGGSHLGRGGLFAFEHDAGVDSPNKSVVDLAVYIFGGAGALAAKFGSGLHQPRDVDGRPVALDRR